MREPAFTPGPWVLGSEGLAGTICVTADGDKVVCELDGFGCDVSPDARLIAAAPALYEALSALRLQVLQSELNCPSNEYAYEALQMANNALSLARGESPNA